MKLKAINKNNINIDDIKIAELNMLATVFGGQSKVAEVLSVDKSRISRWHKGEKADNNNLLKLAGLNYLISILLSVYREETVIKWFFGVNSFLNNRRPIDLIKENRYQEVIDAAIQTAAGSYA